MPPGSCPAGGDWPDFSKWVTRLKGLKEAAKAPFEEQPAETRPGMLHPYHAAKAAVTALDPDTTVITDGGESSAWCDMHLKSAGPGRFMSNGYLGCLGCGPGMAIGAATARPGSRVAVFSGDGAAGFNLQEFDTMVRHGLPVIAVVGNDGSWAQIAREQVVWLKDDVGTVLNRTAYHKVVEGYGGKGFLLEDPNKIDETLARAQQAAREGLPVLINVMIGSSDFRKGSLSM